MAAFLGLLDPPAGFSFQQTWEKDVPKQKREKEGWWTGTAEENAAMHLQGRRWGGQFPYVGWGDSIMNSAACFESYGCAMGDRQALLEAVPESHKAFLKGLPWSLEMPLGEDGRRLLFVHAGLEDAAADGATWEEQLEVLARRDCTVARHETLSGRKNVLSAPQGLIERGDTTLISGHHGIIGVGKDRVILDSSAGKWDNPLSAMLWPDGLVFQNDKEDPILLAELPKLKQVDRD